MDEEWRHYDEDADNGNRSAIHWEMVCIQSADYGGGEIYFDGELIHKDGRFMVEDLISLSRTEMKIGTPSEYSKVEYSIGVPIFLGFWIFCCFCVFWFLYLIYSSSKRYT
jgi:hypothetical protein